MIRSSSSTEEAPDTQQECIVSSVFISSVNSFIMTMSQMEMRPPGFNARKISLYTRGLLSERLMTQFEIHTSAIPSAIGRFSISPNAEFYITVLLRLAISLDFASISGVISTPIARPLLPTAFAARKQSNPEPLPRSKTISPG